MTSLSSESDAHDTILRVTDAEPRPDPQPATPADEEFFDVVVIGAGSTGTNVAGYARDNGLSVAVVEDRLVGGECSYWACMPSKALLIPGAVRAAAARTAGLTGSGPIDETAVLAWRDKVIAGLDDHDQADWIDSIGAVLIRGRGRLVGRQLVEVTDCQGPARLLRAGRGVVIATGSSPSLPPVPGLDDERVWDNRAATTTSHVPERLGVVGGGPVGCELAQAFQRLGSQVTIIESADRLLTRFPAASAAILHDALHEDGVTVRTGTELQSVRASVGGLDVACTDGEEIRVDRLLVATGRRFNTDDVGLESVGLEPGGALEVDDELRVVNIDGGWLFAAGDVNGRALLTHQGKYQARCLGDILAGRQVTAYADHDAVPQVVFTDPEAAAVGLNEDDVAGSPTHRVVSVDASSVAAASLAGQTRGRASLVIDNERGVVVGASFVGHAAGEVLHAATIAIVGQVPVERLWHAVPSFPTMSELWLRLLEADRGM